MRSEVEIAELAIKGMDCADCALHIEQALGQLPGVERVEVLLAAERATIAYDASKVSLPQMVRVVEELGYRVGEGDRSRKPPLAGLLGTAFLVAVALLILVEMVAERLGLLEAVLGRIPAPIAIAAVLIGGYPIFMKVYQGLRSRKVTAHALMTIGILGALSIRQFESAALIVFFMRFADFLEGFTTERSRAAIKELVKLTPKVAWLKGEEGEREVPIEEIRPGNIVVVKPGERIPVDGRVVAGSAAVDQAPLTGESMPAEKGVGDEVLAASICQAGSLQIETMRVGADTSFGRIVKLVEEAEASKAPVQRFADRFTAYYIPVVLAAAAVTYLVSRNPVAAVAVLLVACACAIAIATPMVVVASVGSAARKGILIKGGLYLEALAKVDTLLMDKTGTLTFGEPRVTEVLALNGFQEERVLMLAAIAERFSEHPLASALVKEARSRHLALEEPESFSVLAGRGVQARSNGALIRVGSPRFLEEEGINIPDQARALASAFEGEGQTTLLVAQDSQLAGLIAVADQLRPEVPQAMTQLRALGIRELTLITGDSERVASRLASRLEVGYRAQMLPHEKIQEVRRLQALGRKVAMVGDGINDAPALAAADVGIAMGVAGTEVALEAADVALMRDDWLQVPEAIRIGRRAFATIKENLALSVLYNVIGIALASLGILSPVLAAAGQSLPDVAIMLNSAKLLRSPRS